MVAVCVAPSLASCSDGEGADAAGRRTVRADPVNPADPHGRAGPGSAPGPRRVGVGGVTVAVPAAWGTGLTRCLKPVAPTVYLETGAMTDCADEPTDRERRVPSLAVVDPTSGLGEALLARLRPAGEVDGDGVLDSGPGCLPHVPLLPGPEHGRAESCSSAVAVPEAGALFVATAWGAEAQATVAGIRSSLAVLPPGYITVPLAGRGSAYTPGTGAPAATVPALASAIEDAGLRVETVRDGRTDVHEGTYLGADPPLGTPLPRGATVTLRLASGAHPGGRPARQPGGTGDPAYRRWLARGPLPGCGTDERKPEGDLADEPYAACLREALAGGTGAEAVVTTTTREGDPVVSYLRVTPAGDVERYVDSTQDDFGVRGWRYRTCPDLAAALRGGC